MHARQELLLDFISDTPEGFRIPLFQRSYSWTTEQCDELWRDALRAGKGAYRHFTGTILYKPNDDATLMIVDGQQRTTTLLLLLAAIANHLEQQGATLDGLDANALRQRFLCDASGAQRLIPSEHDQAPFAAAMGNGAYEDKMAETVCFRNLRFFEEQIAQPDFDLATLWSGLNALDIVVVELTEDDDARAVFESFNSRGVPLNACDLVRNYMLMSAETYEEQQLLYERYWIPSQDMFADDPGSLRMNAAVRTWLTVRCQTEHAKKDAEAFRVFKRFFEDEHDGSIETIARELYSFCIVWCKNFHYNPSKKFRSEDWALMGGKTLVESRYGKKKAEAEAAAKAADAQE